MLSVRNLGVVALVTGYASLLGPGLAEAVTIKLDGTDAEAPRPVTYAVETLGESTSTNNIAAYHLQSPGGPGNEELKLAVSANRRIIVREEVYVRLRLREGMVFATDADPGLEIVDAETDTPVSGTAVSFVDRIFGGSAGSDAVVFRLRPPGFGIDIGDYVVIDVTNDLAVNGRIGIYSAEISAHTDADEAIDGAGARGTLFGARADIIELTQGLDVHLSELETATAEASGGYLRFVDPSDKKPLAGQAWLGFVWVAAKRLEEGAGVLNAGTGEEVESEDLVAEGGVNIKVDGNLSVGAFRFFEDRLFAPRPGGEVCPGSGAASAESPDRGSLVDEGGELLVGESGEPANARSGYSSRLDAHTAGSLRFYSFCVNVDVLGEATNRKPIPNSDYHGTVMITGTAPGARPMEAGSGLIGKIQRNGTFVSLPYLTASERYSQQLIILNRGISPALFVLGEFTTEQGTQVELSAAAEATRLAGRNVVPANGVVILDVAEVLVFSGEQKRASATLGLNADPDDIQVATVLNNLIDGATDTIVYPSVSGLQP